jgi:streptomycin 6-kinase
VRAIAERDGALLMERAVPGRALTERVLVGRDDEATEVLCDVAARLHLAGRPSHDAPAVEDWGQGFTRFRQGQGSGIEPGLLDRAERLFRELAASQGRRCLLHGDLHHDNVVNDARRGWLAIDPKGVVGEPAYEFGALLRNPTRDAWRFADVAILDRRAALLAERGGHERDRVLAWAFAQGVLSAVWSWEDGQPDDRGLVTARAVLPLL